MTSMARIRSFEGGLARDAAGFLRAFIGFAGWRAAGGAALLAIGALVDGVGLLLLVPILGIVTATMGGPASGGRFVAPLAHVLRSLGQNERLLILLGVFASVMLARGVVLAARDRAVSRVQLEFVEAIRLGL